MIPTFQEKYVISSSRELLGQEKVTLHGRKGFISKFRELQTDGEHYILWVVIFGDSRITYSASASYPESKDKELEDHYFKMMKEVKLRFEYMAASRITRMLEQPSCLFNHSIDSLRNSFSL